MQWQAQVSAACSSASVLAVHDLHEIFASTACIRTAYVCLHLTSRPAFPQHSTAVCSDLIADLVRTLPKFSSGLVQLLQRWIVLLLACLLHSLNAAVLACLLHSVTYRLHLSNHALQGSACREARWVI
jgi:hypothetical protein